MLTECVKSGNAEGRVGWRIKFDYDADIIETLKKRVPHTEREWNPDERYWWVGDEYQETLKLLFRNFESFLFQGKLF